MQLILIVQVSIALLAGELSGMLTDDALLGALCLAGAPLVVLAQGALLARVAHRQMDRGDRRGVERCFASAGTVGWKVAVLLAAAATSGLPSSLGGGWGGVAVTAAFLLSIVASAVASYAMLWPVEKRVRESSLMRELDAHAPIHPMPSRTAYVLAQARAGLIPMLLPLLVPVATSELGHAVAMRLDPSHAEEARLAGGVAGAVLLFLLVPLIVPPLLGLRRMAAGPLRDDLQSLARDAGVAVRDIWVWPTDGLVANAAVMGVLPGLRCVMLSDCLLECMPREQVRAVMAHELGHVARRHLPWMLVVVLACWIALTLVATPVVQVLAERYAAEAPSAPVAEIAQVAALLRDAVVLALGLAAFGYASRRFERQADTYAVQLLSGREQSPVATVAAVDAMVGALGSVALLNHVPPERPSWRHGSIEWRQGYLRGIAGLELRALPIDRLVAALCWASLCIAGAGVALGFLPF